MNSLPTSSSLQVESLSAAFQNTTNSYKFYWFLALLDHVQKNEGRIHRVDSLKSNMIASIWYPASYFQLSFGKQDQLTRITQMLDIGPANLKDVRHEHLMDKIVFRQQESSDFAKAFRSLGRYVPYRFLEPFFRTELRGKQDSHKNSLITELSEQSFTPPNRPCIYRFTDGGNTIEIHAEWHLYIQQHLVILKEYCLWNLLSYLQKHNPNVPNIAGKLFPPQNRSLGNVRKYWRHVLEHSSNEVRCIYSDIVVLRQNLSLDHFLPWRYVTHDLLWNLTPTVRSVNSSKGDQLPDIELYFDRFATLQYEALLAVNNSKMINARVMEDYTLLFGCENYAELMTMSHDTFREKLYETMAPQLQIARNMGFVGDWTYTHKHDL